MHYNMLFIPSKFEINPIKFAQVMAFFICGVKRKVNAEKDEEKTQKIRQILKEHISKTAGPM